MRNLLLALVISLSLAHPALKASNYYVSTTGNNMQAGTFSNPWKTIQYGLDSAHAGDTVFIRAGEYNEQVVSHRSGTASNRIVLCGYPNEQVIIDGTGVSGVNNGLIITNSFITLKNIEVRDWTDTGVWIYGNIDSITVLDCKVHNCPFCLSLSDGVHNFLIDNALIYDFGPPSGGGNGFGFSVEPNGVPCYNGLITNSKSYHELDTTANNDGFALGHHDVSNITFRNCETYDVFDGFDVSGHNVLLEQCSAHHITNGDGAYKLWPDSITLVNCIGYHSTSNVQLDYDGRTAIANLFNCTFHDAIGLGYNIWIENSTTSHLNMYNCIVSGGDNRGFTFEQSSYSNYSGDYNIFQNDDTVRAISTLSIDISIAQIQSGVWNSLSSQDLHSIALVSSASLFINDNGAAPDLHLKAGSEAINTGTSAHAPQSDYTGCLRNDGHPDIGAYEYGCFTSGINATSKSPKSFLIFPNPVTEVITIKLNNAIPCKRYNIFEHSGKQVLSGKITNEITTVDISKLSNGIYLLTVDELRGQSFEVINK